jgi:hypothetical protein
MELFHLLDNVASIKINVAERNNLARMLTGCLSHYFARRKWSQDTGCEIERAADLQQVADETRTCLIEMHVHVNNPLGSR